MLDIREPQQSALMSVGELATLLGLHVKVVYRLALRGDFDDVRVVVGGLRLVRFSRERVMAAIRNGRIGRGPTERPVVAHGDRAASGPDEAQKISFTPSPPTNAY